MASTVATQVLGSRLRIVPYDHDPAVNTIMICSADGGTTPWFWDLKDYRNFGVVAKISSGTTPSITLLEIIASASATMSTPTIVKTTGAVVLDNYNDYAFLECTDDEVLFLGSTLRYVAARLTQAGNADNEAVVTYIGTPKTPGLDTTTPVQQA